MNKISEALAEIADLHKTVGTAELSRMTGIPYMTIKDAASRGFRHRSTDVLEALADVAAKPKRKPIPAKQASA